MDYHPIAAMFPLMEEEELQDLVDSIRDKGLRETIKLHEGKIVDGRNRYVACQLAGVAPRFEDAPTNGSMADYVYDLNYQRRHLTDGARKLAAGRYKKIAAEEAKERKKATEGRPKKGQKKPVAKSPQVSREPAARDVAGDKFGVSGKAVDASEKILKNGSVELIKAVESGDVKITTAERLAKAPKRVQAEAVKGGPKAIRKAIENHNPSPSEVAKNDPAVRWHKAMHDILVRFQGMRENGIESLCREWSDEQKERHAQDLEQFIQEFRRWIKALRRK